MAAEREREGGMCHETNIEGDQYTWYDQVRIMTFNNRILSARHEDHHKKYRQPRETRFNDTYRRKWPWRSYPEWKWHRGPGDFKGNSVEDKDN